MFKDDYKDTFSKVTASDETCRRVMSMTKQKKTRSFRGTVGKVLIAAAVLSTLAVTASAAEFGWFQRYFEDKSRTPLSQPEVEFIQQSQQTINESQTRDGYTLTVKSAITDGRMAYINIGITAPEGQVLSKTEIPGYDPSAPSIEAGNFGPELFVPAQGYEMTGSMGLVTMDDFDGRDNTQDWLLTVEKDGELPFAPGSIWKLHVEDLVATYQNAEYQKELNENSGSEPGTLMELTREEAEKLSPKVTLAEGVWDIEVEFKECDTRTIEFIKEPVSAACIVGWQEDGPEIAEVPITSFALGTLSATITADTKHMPEFTSFVGGKYIHAVMKDGSQVRLRPASAATGQQKLEAERPILLDNVDHVLLADGTRLPMP